MHLIRAHWGCRRPRARKAFCFVGIAVVARAVTRLAANPAQHGLWRVLAVIDLGLLGLATRAVLRCQPETERPIPAEDPGVGL